MVHQVCERTAMCATLTREKCAVACRSLNFSLYGVEAGHQCYCDDQLAHPSRQLLPNSSSSTCHVPCIGNSQCFTNELCGGSDQLWVGRVADAAPPQNCSSPVQPAEPRNIANGTLMYKTGYLDQPYCVENPQNGEWTCTTTAGDAHEGGGGEHMVSQVSSDQGLTWSEPTFVEPRGIGIDNSYGTLAITTFGRIYCIYNMNLDNITKLPDGKDCGRTDELGHFVMRYSDTGGRTWSHDRYEVPYRLTPLDTHNSWHGKVKIMWCVDQVKQIDNSTSIIFGFTKIGTYVQNAPQELWFLRSDNLLTERDAAKVEWTLLPEGDHGILPPGVTSGPPTDMVGDVLEEAHIVPLYSGGFYAVGRTTQGYLAAAFTEKSGPSSWPRGSATYAAYYDPRTSAAGKLQAIPVAKCVRHSGSSGYGLKNPRGPITPKRMANGLYLMLFYNNAGASFGQRDPYWLTCGHEVPGTDHGILWSQPEIVLYDRYGHTREAGGYPDFIQSGKTGEIYITETQKDTSRIHKISAQMLSALFTQHNASTVSPGYTTTLKAGQSSVPAPKFPSIMQWTAQGQGFTLSLVLDQHNLAKPGEAILDARSISGGMALLTGAEGSVVLSLRDSSSTTAERTAAMFETDPLCSAELAKPGPHYVGIVVDAGPMIVTFVVDGLVCDGGHAGARWAAGWSWLPPIHSLQGSDLMTVGNCSAHSNNCEEYAGKVSGYIYTKALMNSELVASFRAMLR
jgi:hypothetical protein